MPLESHSLGDGERALVVLLHLLMAHPQTFSGRLLTSLIIVRLVRQELRTRSVSCLIPMVCGTEQVSLYPRVSFPYLVDYKTPNAHVEYRFLNSNIAIFSSYSVSVAVAVCLFRNSAG
jgi:hypothetical protein